MGRKLSDLTGKKFGRLTVVKRVENKGHETMWLCRCDCGNQKNITAGNLKSHKTKSCGCIRKEIPNGTRHSYSNTRIYNLWGCMIQRCHNPKNPKYVKYGARGIIVCDEWKNDFENFRRWSFANGYNDNLTIDRIDVNGNYEPSNCRWTTIKEQANNTRRNHYITYKGETKTLKQWSEDLGINYSTLRSRVTSLNWTTEKAFSTP